MKYLALSLLLATALGASASAATPPNTDATLICRPATTADHANASLKDPSTDLICKPFSMAMKMSDGSMHMIGAKNVSGASIGPDITRGFTAQQVNDSWVKYMEMAFSIDHTP